MYRSFLTLITVSVLAACGGSTATTTSAAPATSPATTAAPTSTTAAPGSTTTTEAGTTTTSSSTTSTTLADDTVVIEVGVENGAVVGENRISVDLNADVRLIVSVDVSDEVHIHGYDIFGDVAAGAPATIEFVASIPGIFEVELEGAGLELLELVVGA